MLVSKPKQAGGRDPKNQENNIQYWTYYRNEYNQDTNKRTNIYGSNTRHRGEQGYNRNPRQDNSHDAITFKQKRNNHQNNESEEIGDTLVEVLTLINGWASTTETIIVPET